MLRFDKVTYAHAADVRAQADFTLFDEHVPHACAAIELRRGHPAVDHSRVFVAGHSLGGTVAPRVAAAEPAVAGQVILAGGAAPWHWVIVRQIRYLASLDPATAAVSVSGIEAHAPAAVAALGKPMLVLQGGRDYQATVEDDMLRWQTALADRPDVTIRVYPADDHFFFGALAPRRRKTRCTQASMWIPPWSRSPRTG